MYVNTINYLIYFFIYFTSQYTAETNAMFDETIHIFFVYYYYNTRFNVNKNQASVETNVNNDDAKTADLLCWGGTITINY